MIVTGSTEEHWENLSILVANLQEVSVSDLTSVNFWTPRLYYRQIWKTAVRNFYSCIEATAQTSGCTTIASFHWQNNILRKVYLKLGWQSSTSIQLVTNERQIQSHRVPKNISFAKRSHEWYQLGTLRWLKNFNTCNGCFFLWDSCCPATTNLWWRNPSSICIQNTYKGSERLLTNRMPEKIT